VEEKTYRINVKRFNITVSVFIICIIILYGLFGHQFIRIMHRNGIMQSLTFGRVFEEQTPQTPDEYYSIIDKYILYSVMLLVIFLIIFNLKPLSGLDLLSRFIAASAFTALLVSAVIIAKRALTAHLYLNCWNDISWWNNHYLAWTFSIKKGYRLYYGPDTGPVISRMYGPLAALVYLPVTIFNYPTIAIISASFLSASFFFLPVLWLHMGGSSFSLNKRLYGLYAFSCFCLIVFNSPPLALSAFLVKADAPALGFAAISCAFLYYRVRKKDMAFLLSAVFSVLSVWTKQTMLPLLLALPVYILLSDGVKNFKRYLLYICASGILISSFFLIITKPQNLFFNIVTIPARAPWWPGHRYVSYPPWVFNKTIAMIFHKAFIELMKEGFLFVVILFAIIVYSLFRARHLTDQPDKSKTWFRSNCWVMPIVVSLFMVPSSMLARIKYGGLSYVLSPALYFLISGFTIALGGYASTQPSIFAPAFHKAARTILIIMVTLLCGATVVKFCNIGDIMRGFSGSLTDAAYEYAKRHPGEAYFPDNPLASLLAEGKLYHSGCGLTDREMTGFKISLEHFMKYVPSNIKIVARPHGSPFIYEMMDYPPGFSKRINLEELPGWIVYTRK